MPLLSRASVALSVLALGLASPAAAQQVPLRVFSHDLSPSTETATLNVPGGANPAASLYAQIHNLRYGGQVSVRVNGGDWTHLYNHSVELLEPERSQGGIGGINATLRFTIPLAPGTVAAGQPNSVDFRLNGSDGVTSAIRVLDFDFLDSSGARIVAPGGHPEEDPGTWSAPLPGQVGAGQTLWTSGAIVNDSINQAPINATCSSCHFRDGSDLKYFNYSNDSIITRARFHGLTQTQGEQIASYIRTRVTPNPGRPWNPPFQPGPNLDPDPGDSPALAQQKAESWMAGAGVDAVVESEAEILPQVFPGGTSPAAIGKVIDHEGTFSVREVPIPIQFPDWNTWLPDLAPEDMWSDPVLYTAPYGFYNTLRSTLDTQGAAALTSAGNLNATFEKFKNDLENWYGTFRLPDEDLANDTAVSLARNAPLTREDVIKSLMRWMVIKMMEVTRDHDLEAEQDSVGAMQAKGHPNFTPELLSIPAGENRAIVFGLAPHISGNIYVNFENQPEHLGKMESNQWYHLQLCLNSGYRMQVNMNVPLDWAYQIIHLESASERAGFHYGFQRLVTQIKMLQIRETGKGIQQGGFSQRTLNPCFFYSGPFRDRSLMAGALDAVEPGLWRKVFEEYLYEWLDVIQGHDLGTMPRGDADRHQFETSTYVPVPWPGGSAKFFDRPGETHADALYRLLPLLPREGIDEMLLSDIVAWCKLAWPYNAATWGSTPDWDSLLVTTRLYAEDFEDGLSDFDVTAAVLTPTAIKDANYVNSNGNVPRNGGGAFVAERGLTGGGAGTTIRQGINDTINVPLGGATRLELKARVAFRDGDGIDPGAVHFKMRLRFDTDPTTYDAEDTLVLDPDLFDTEFESYESHLDLPAGAANITWLAVWWERIGGTGGGTVYIDNIHLLPVDETVDTTAPAAPVLTNVTANANLRLRLNWSDTNPPADGVAGYKVYRRIDGQPLASAVKLNTGLVDNPYIFYEDYTAQRGINYRFHITAVDAAGNESAPSNEKTRTLPDIDTPLSPPTLWAVQTPGNLDFSWFGVRTWDLGGFDVYRRVNGEPFFTMLTTPMMAEETLSFSDPTAIDGISYEYYVESFDVTGTLSAPSSILSLVSATGVTHVDAWSLGFNGTNGWNSSDPLISGNGVDFDLDGSATLWEYLQGKNPALADAEPPDHPDASLVEDGGECYLELTYRRLEDLPPGILVKVQCSNDLTAWPVEYVVEGAIPDLELTVSPGAPAGGRRTVTVRLNIPIGDPGSYSFARLLLEEQ